ncbi:hypothetical protein KCP73_19535 [Salmonella enterica subsp. enterica]|nr:hypothetical protein KCP73_19535 [Salmonella enterica subsp. enterica]
MTCYCCCIFMVVSRHLVCCLSPASGTFITCCVNPRLHLIPVTVCPGRTSWASCLDDSLLRLIG